MNNNAVMINLTWLDWAVVAVYAVAMFAIAFWAMRKIKDCGGFLLGKRRMGKLMLMATMFAGGTNANHPMGVAAATYTKGLSGMWLSLTWMLITPFMWMYPPVLRRLRVVTMVDMIQLRFGKVMAFVFKLVGVLAGPISMGLGIKSAAIVIEVMTGGAIKGMPAMLAITVPTLIYTLMGGVVAAYATDVLQGVLIIVLSFMLIPFAIVKAGGVAALDAGIADNLTQLISTEAGEGFGFWWILWFLVGCLFAAPLASGGGALSARNEMSARMQMFGLICKRFCTLGWGFTGLFAIALYAGNEALAASPDKVFPMAAGDLLPVVLRGLMVASMMAAVMSSLDGALLGFCGMITKNFYEEYLVKNGSAKHYLLMTRLFAVISVVLAFLWAGANRSLIDYITLVEPLGSLCGVAVLVCLMWRGVTKHGAIASVLVMFPLFYVVQKTALVEGLASLPGGVRQAAELLQRFYALTGNDVAIHTGKGALLPVEISYPLYLVPGILTIVIVSLFTKQHNARAVQEFYARLDTPVGEEDKLRSQGFHEDDLEQLDHEVIHVDPKDHDISPRLLLTDLLYLPKLLATRQTRWSDYKVDLIGVAGSIVFVWLFIMMVSWIGSFF